MYLISNLSRCLPQNSRRHVQSPPWALERGVQSLDSAMQLQGSGLPLSTQTRAVLGSLESVWAARQPTLPLLSAPAPGQPSGSTPIMPTPDQQALLSALLKAITRHKQPGKPSLTSTLVHLGVVTLEFGVPWCCP